MKTDDRVYFFENLVPTEKYRLMDTLGEVDMADIRRLATSDDHSICAIMISDYMVLS